MLTLLGSVVPGILARGRFNATPGVDKPDETIDGFPEFTQDVGLINDPTIKPRLRALAKRIVASHRTGRRIIGFEVHGHADKTVRISNATEAERTEDEVSQERADNARDLLLQLIEEEGGKPIIAGIRANATSKGFGSRFRIFVPAHNEAQMKKNRRVEIFLKEFASPPPRPTPPPQPNPPQHVTGSRWRIQIINGTTNTLPTPTELSVFTMVLTVEITDLDRGLKARFQVKTAGTSLPGSSSASGAGIGPSFVKTGTPTEFKVPNGVTINDFAGSVDVGESPGASASVLSAGGQFGFSFTEMEKRGRFTSPSAVEVEGGSDPLGLPQVNLGAVSSGTMTMLDAPTPVQQ